MYRDVSDMSIRGEVSGVLSDSLEVQSSRDATNLTDTKEDDESVHSGPINLFKNLYLLSVYFESLKYIADKVKQW